ATAAGPAVIRAGDLTVDPDTYAAKLKGQPLDLTYKEFELLRFLAQHPGRVFTREQLLREVWGYDYFGGTRTVDVHVRRLRAKLGSEYESMIGTVRQVGYKFVAPPPDTLRDSEPDRSGSTPEPRASPDTTRAAIPRDRGPSAFHPAVTLPTAAGASRRWARASRSSACRPS
ncbi:response regulator transcription factor, partial [Glycomyces tenuis]|uniref:winged helix-turn-helix domain-containing protein n=1 Tax=Glycomyces tenuis TaxID=58116 RepID=UPI0031F6AB50